jgi:transposase InsO family protein
VEEQREEFAIRASKTENFSALCRAYGISRPTGYKWLRRAEQGETMEDRSHVPKHIPNKTAPAVEAAILSVRAEHPSWGGKKIRKVLENRKVEGLPGVKSCSNILRRNGCISNEASAKSKPFIRFERALCNELWQTDFKGDFALKDGSRCYPLTILDDHSRFSIAIDPKPCVREVSESFRRAFTEFGLPDAVLSDNGWTFRGLHGGFTMFERWLMEHDVLPIHGRVRHPQTQGKIERFHGSMKEEALKGREFDDLEHAAHALSVWRDIYNSIRPHEAIGMRCPAQVYVKSGRVYTDRVSDFNYNGDFRVIKVNSWGYARFAHFQVFLSETFANQFLEFRPNPLGGSWCVCFRNFCIVEFDALSGSLIKRFIRRI